MAHTPYVKTVYVNDSTPAISAENLNKSENELEFLDVSLSENLSQRKVDEFYNASSFTNVNYTMEEGKTYWYLLVSSPNNQQMQVRTIDSGGNYYNAVTLSVGTKYKFVSPDDYVGLRIGVGTLRVIAESKMEQDVTAISEDLVDVTLSTLYKADAEIDYSTPVTMTLQNGAINKKGTTTYTGSANYKHARIDNINKGEKYSIDGLCLNNADHAYTLVSILDSSNNVLSTPYNGANGIVKGFTFTIPENADHMFVNFDISTNYGLYKGSPMSVDATANEIKSQLISLSNYYETQNRRALYNLSFNAPFNWLPFDKGYISWMNDDARTDMYLYKDLCDQYNIPYANAVPYEKIGQNISIDGTPLITYLKGIITDGGEIFSHALTWLTSSSTEEDFYKQFITSKRTIENAVETEINGIIQAGGSGYSSVDYNKCQEYSISYYQYSDAYGITPQNTLGRLRYLRTDYDSDAEQIAAYKAKIDDAVQNHKWLRLWCHGTDEVSIEVLTAIFEYANEYFTAGTLAPTTWKNMYDTFRSHYKN